MQKGFKKLNYTKSFILVLGILFLISSCTKEVMPIAPAPIPCSTPISYNADIKPLISTYCATHLGAGTGCHDAWIFDYSNVLASVNSGEFGYDITTKIMPKIPNTFGIVAMSDEEIETFRCWIAQGALEN